jgi:hypothetical protein
MRKNPLIIFTLNEKLRLKGIFIFFIGILLFVLNFYFDFIILNFISIISIIIGFSSYVLFTNNFISIFEYYIEYKFGLLWSCRVIHMSNIESVIKGKNTFVINLKYSEKPLVVELYKLNCSDIFLFKAIMSNFQRDISLLFHK